MTRRVARYRDKDSGLTATLLMPVEAEIPAVLRLRHPGEDFNCHEYWFDASMEPDDG